MDALTNKQYGTFDYVCRYTGVPYFYNTNDDRDLFGIGYNLLKTTAWVAHKVTQEDTLDKLALKYYNNPTYWWLIAYYNDIEDTFDKLADFYSVLKIPNISSIQFGDMR